MGKLGSYEGVRHGELLGVLITKRDKNWSHIQKESSFGRTDSAT